MTRRLEAEEPRRGWERAGPGRKAGGGRGGDGTGPARGETPEEAARRWERAGAVRNGGTGRKTGVLWTFDGRRFQGAWLFKSRHFHVSWTGIDSASLIIQLRLQICFYCIFMDNVSIKT